MCAVSLVARGNPAGLPSNECILKELIKTGGNRGYWIRVARGLTYILEYFRVLRRKGEGPPAYITISRIVRTLRIEDTRGNRTDIGVALSRLASLGYLERRSNGSNKSYNVTDKMFEHFEHYPCLKGCTSDSSICGLLGTLDCPFLQGVLRGDYGGQTQRIQ